MKRKLRKCYYCITGAVPNSSVCEVVIQLACPYRRHAGTQYQLNVQCRLGRPYNYTGPVTKTKTK